MFFFRSYYVRYSLFLINWHVSWERVGFCILSHFIKSLFWKAKCYYIYSLDMLSELGLVQFSSDLVCTYAFHMYISRTFGKNEIGAFPSHPSLKEHEEPFLWCLNHFTWSWTYKFIYFLDIIEGNYILLSKYKWRVKVRRSKQNKFKRWMDHLLIFLSKIWGI